MQSREMLGAGELARFRARLQTWASSYASRGWPSGTPEYLLRGYFQLLRAEGDLERMIEALGRGTGRGG